jgi:hypothetical protein
MAVGPRPTGQETCWLVLPAIALTAALLMAPAAATAFDDSKYPDMIPIKCVIAISVMPASTTFGFSSIRLYERKAITLGVDPVGFGLGCAGTVASILTP